MINGGKSIEQRETEMRKECGFCLLLAVGRGLGEPPFFVGGIRYQVLHHRAVVRMKDEMQIYKFLT